MREEEVIFSAAVGEETTIFAFVLQSPFFIPCRILITNEISPKKIQTVKKNFTPCIDGHANEDDHKTPQEIFSFSAKRKQTFCAVEKNVFLSKPNYGKNTPSILNSRQHVFVRPER